ncbi:gamma-glutamylcyclotransferase [Photobacterium chitinilyticum]|uniref:gamma-glutamylcyclotransferase family protein n=1 Tax=Photobacterium chitinilyticum TaxID=2485123 RepID=UPI003D0CDEA1
MARVFVYGTLRTGQSNHSFLGKASKLGACQLVSGYSLFNLGCYPGAKKSISSHTPLYGEVYDVDSNTMALLDQLEEYPELYTRELVDTEFGAAWIYLYCLSVIDLPLIHSGDWCRK